MRKLRPLYCFITLLLLPLVSFAAIESSEHIDLTRSVVGYTCLAIFCLAYILVMVEEFTDLRKSKPVLLAAGLIWGLIAWVYASHGLSHAAEEYARDDLLEYAELMLFLLVAMTYVNSMEERQVFNRLRAWMIGKGFSLRNIYWLTGLLAFVISPVADNLTTALLMCAVVLAVARNNKGFVSLCCINIVIAANAGGAFSPFGDITTLMVWQKGLVQFGDFFHIFIPSLVSWLVPAALMQFKVPKEKPEPGKEAVTLRYGAVTIVALFLVTIGIAVCFHNFLHLPPVLGMLTGLSLLKLYGFWIRRKEEHLSFVPPIPDHIDRAWLHEHFKPKRKRFDVFVSIKRAEWDTLFFFYGVVMCVGGLGMIGYLAIASETIYNGWGATNANIAIGLLSAIVDNIPVMFAVLTMNPDMALGQWLLVTLTAGIGGSLLSIGSAAGVALMGQARGVYTFSSHIKWTPVIALGYGAGVATHMWINAALF